MYTTHFSSKYRSHLRGRCTFYLHRIHKPWNFQTNTYSLPTFVACLFTKIAFIQYFIGKNWPALQITFQYYVDTRKTRKTKNLVPQTMHCSYKTNFRHLVHLTDRNVYDYLDNYTKMEVSLRISLLSQQNNELDEVLNQNRDVRNSNKL